MCLISVVLIVPGTALYVEEAVESVLAQTWKDFELIIGETGEDDRLSAVLGWYADPRIVRLQPGTDYVALLNDALSRAGGKYIACMGASDRMHADRLQVQYAFMEEEPSMVVCGSWVSPFGREIPQRAVIQTVFGWLDPPFLHLLKGNPVFHATALIRTAFLKKYGLRYRAGYQYAEDYRLWSDVAEHGGRFYIESQPLMYCRLSDETIDTGKQVAYRISFSRVRNEIVTHLLARNCDTYPSLSDLLPVLKNLIGEELITDDEAVEFVCRLFSKNKNRMDL